MICVDFFRALLPLVLLIVLYAGPAVRRAANQGAAASGSD
jgi:hypothetical protein